MNKSKTEAINYYFCIKPQRIYSKEKLPQKKYKIGLYRDIQKIDSLEQQFTFANNYYFNNIQIVFHLHKQSNPQITLTLYAIQLEDGVQVQNQQGQISINFQYFIDQMITNSQHKFIKNDKVGPFQFFYYVYVSENKNGLSYILGTQELSQNTESKKLKKSTTTIDEFTNVSKLNNSTDLGRYNSYTQFNRKRKLTDESNKQSENELGKQLIVSNNQGEYKNIQIQKIQKKDDNKKNRQQKQQFINEIQQQDMNNEKKQKRFQKKGQLIKNKIQQQQKQNYVQSQKKIKSLGIMENIKYILINNRKIKYALLFIFLLIFLSAIIVLLTQNKIHKKNNRKTPESNIKSNKINKQKNKNKKQKSNK